MMGLIGRRCRGTIRADSATGSTSRSTSVNGSVSTYDRLVKTSPELDSREITTLSVNCVVISRWQKNRSRVVVSRISPACNNKKIKGYPLGLSFLSREFKHRGILNICITRDLIAKPISSLSSPPVQIYKLSFFSMDIFRSFMSGRIYLVYK